MNNKEKVIIIFEGLDSAGKGSHIKFMSEHMNPKHYEICTFGIPTDDEKKNWFKRYKEKLPKAGCITFFDRSWYNRAVNDVVMGYCSYDEHSKFLTDVVKFEEDLVKYGYKIIKIWLDITEETQQYRFKKRQVHPLKYWKYSENDSKTSDKYKLFEYFKDKMFYYTSKDNSLWVNVKSDDKKLCILNVIKYILEQFKYENKNEKILVYYPEFIQPIVNYFEVDKTPEEYDKSETEPTIANYLKKLKKANEKL